MFENSSAYELTNALDHEILMHRDAHFGGSFEEMLEYYREEDKAGIMEDFDLDRILFLSGMEKEIGNNLASLILTGAEAEKIAESRESYQQLKEVYAIKSRSPVPALIADLILADEEEPQETIHAIVSHGSQIVPYLVQITRSEDYYDPLFPGYGQAPYLAALCLGKIADPQAIPALFEMLGKESLFGEGMVLNAFFQIGKPAKQFLLKILAGRPLTKDNVHAALALSAFGEEQGVAEAALQQLKDTAVLKNSVLTGYLQCLCNDFRNSNC